MFGKISSAGLYHWPVRIPFLHTVMKPLPVLTLFLILVTFPGQIISSSIKTNLPIEMLFEFIRDFIELPRDEALIIVIDTTPFDCDFYRSQLQHLLLVTVDRYIGFKETNQTREI